MRILYVADYQGPEAIARRDIRGSRHTGGSTKISRIARALVGRGHEVCLLASGYPANRSFRFHTGFTGRVEESEIPVRYVACFDAPRLHAVVARLSMRQWGSANGRWDAILTYNLGAVQVSVSSHLARRYNLPVILEYEDDATIDITGPNRVHRWMGMQQLKRLTPFIRGAIVVCPELSRQFACDNVMVLPGIVDFAPDDQPAPMRAPTKRPKILYCGGLTHAKGPDILLDALQCIQSPLDVDLLGPGPLLDALRSRDTGIHRVKVHGEVSMDAVRAHLRTADICVNPHRMGMGHAGTLFPFKVLEYLAFGKPVVTPAELVLPDEVRAACIPYQNDSPRALAESLERAIADLPFWRQRAETVQKHVLDQYSLPAVGARIERIFDRAVKMRGAA